MVQALKSKDEYSYRVDVARCVQELETGIPLEQIKLSDYPTAESFMKVLLEGRTYETCYEGKRYNDLKRLGKLAEYVLYAKDIVVSPGAYWFPIPNEEFLYNKGLDISKDQNPGY